MTKPLSNLWCALIPLFLLAPSPAIAQDKHGTVKVGSLDVYLRMSTDSDVVTSLARGTIVRVLLTVTDSDGDWCSVASQGSSTRIGYVPSSGLDRPKETPTATTHGGPPPRMIIMQSFSPLPNSSQHTRKIDDGAVGPTLAQLPGYSWGSYQKTLLIAIRAGCPYCEASMPFYRQLDTRERSNMLRAHVLVVMPDDPSTGGGLLRRDNLDVQTIYDQRLGALGIEGTPTLLLLDSSGHIQRAWFGELTPTGEKDVLIAAAK